MQLPRLELIALKASEEIGRWELGCGVFTLGRSPECSIPLDGEGVGEEHARLAVDESGTVTLEAALEVSIDGNPVSGSVRVLPDQYIELGSISLLVEPRTGSDVSLAGEAEEGLPAEFLAGDR